MAILYYTHLKILSFAKIFAVEWSKIRNYTVHRRSELERLGVCNIYYEGTKLIERQREKESVRENREKEREKEKLHTHQDHTLRNSSIANFLYLPKINEVCYTKIGND